MKTADLRLFFVYNANSGVFSGIKDLIDKSISPKTYGCRLCSLTYSGVNMKSEWKEFVNSQPVKADFFHKDEFLNQYPDKQNTTLPAVFIKRDDSLTEIISTQEINQANSMEVLKNLVQTKVASIKYE